jgi:hypothetical protein
VAEKGGVMIENHVVSLEMAKRLNWPWETEYAWALADTTNDKWKLLRLGELHLHFALAHAPLATEMLERMPKNITYNNGLFHLEMYTWPFKQAYSFGYAGTWGTVGWLKEFRGESIVDALASLCIWLFEQGHMRKEER